MSIGIRRLKNGCTVYDVRLRTARGQQYTKTFRTRKEADAFEAEERSARLHGISVDPHGGQVEFGRYADLWLKNRPGLRPRSVELYDYLLRHYLRPEFEAARLADITPAWVRRWHANLSYRPNIGPSTVAKSYRLLRTMLGTAVEDELIARNPCVLKRASIEHHDERPVASVEQIAALADAVGPKYRAMVLLATWCSLRFGELAGLVRADIDLSARVVNVSRQLQELQDGSHLYGPPKSEAGRRAVAIPPHVLVDVKAHLDAQVGLAADTLVFATPEGTPLRRSNFNRRVWQPACAAVGLKGFRFHDLRHSGNTLAASTGASLKELMRRMGHASPRAALIYQHATAERDRAVAEALSRLAEPKATLRATPNLQLIDAQNENSGPHHTHEDGSGCAMDVRWSGPEGSREPLTRPKDLVKRVETMGLEPTTPCVQSRCSSH
jgi:integrase